MLSIIVRTHIVGGPAFFAKVWLRPGVVLVPWSGGPLVPVVVLWSGGPLVILKYFDLQHLRCSKTR